MTVQRYHCEELYAAGRAEEATLALLKILDTFGEEIHASKATSEWVMGEYRDTNQIDDRTTGCASALSTDGPCCGYCGFLSLSCFLSFSLSGLFLASFTTAAALPRSLLPLSSP